MGRDYLAAGGPSSRLEKLLSRAAREQSFSIETFASPTGLFVTVRDQKNPTELCTLVSRIESMGIRFDVIERVERALLDFKLGERGEPDFLSTLGLVARLMAAFTLGLSLSLVHSGWSWGAPVCGLLTVLVVMLDQPLSKWLGGNGVFTEFVLSLLSFGIGGLLARQFGFPTESLLIGPLLYLVPGLTLTTAVSELAEQNFISGTAKLMKGILTLFAMGAALLLLQDFGRLTGWAQGSFSPATIQLPAAWILMVFNAGFVWSFSKLFYLPTKALWGAWLTSTLSGLIFSHLPWAQELLILPTFVTSLAVGLVSLSLGTLLKMPSQCFSVPGIFSMLPGLLALGSFERFASGLETTGSSFAFRVFLSASVIVLGLLCARIPFAIRRSGQTELHHGTL